MATEQRKIPWNSIARNAIGGLVLVFLLSILLAIIGGPRFAPYLGWFGLSIRKGGGVFMDCSRPENRNHFFCGGRDRAEDKQWKDIEQRDVGRSVPFSLY